MQWYRQGRTQPANLSVSNMRFSKQSKSLVLFGHRRMKSRLAITRNGSERRLIVGMGDLVSEEAYFGMDDIPVKVATLNAPGVPGLNARSSVK